jgi:cytochrome c
MLTIHKFQNLVFIFFILLCLAACNNRKPRSIQRPLDTWAFRSVLDRKPRMLTIALDSECYAAYDLAHCTLYKVWKGGVILEGAVYTNKKNVQPTTWGAAYYENTIEHSKWNVERSGNADSFHIASKGYVFRNNQIHLKFELILSGGDTIYIEERPEFVRSETGKPGLERLFSMSGSTDGITVSLISKDTAFTLDAKKSSALITWFNPLPAQFQPQAQEAFDAQGKYWIEKSDCLTCHEFDIKTVGPSFNQVALRYANEKNPGEHLIRKIKEGGSGKWGTAVMNAHPNLTEDEIKVMLDYILSLKPKDKQEINLVTEEKAEPVKNAKPGFGAPLEAVHPSYDLTTIHSNEFKSRVGGLAFLPDGRLLVTTWDSTGGVYLLSGVETGDTNKIHVKRIASGLQEPLGMAVANGKIFVLQKPELTQLIDLNGDDIIDEYRTICNSWGISDDFHEYAFGLAYKDGYFYATLSLAMRLMSTEKQKPDRGKTIKIAMDGSYQWINYGLRQPNGIGIGVDEEIFETDNQGQWLPANKLIHVKKGDYLGMPWGVLPDSLSKPPSATPPAIWLPENEIANSPSEPILIKDGPYKGQMLHGDVTYGGIQRDFLEKVNGEYQGAVFRFTQGLQAGINRLCWGPDGALYVGGIGMEGGWSSIKQYGLQRMKYNGKITFDILAIRAKPNGFEIEFTKTLKPGQNIKTSDFLVQQWWYLPTADYGGPKMDLEKLKINQLAISPDRMRVFLEIPGLKKKHVVYFRLPSFLQSGDGQSLWSSETWYTLNNIPE